MTDTFHVKYNPKTRAITLMMGQYPISISASGNVTVGTTPIPLPFEDFNGFTLAVFDDILEVNNPGLFRIQYYLQYDMIVITVSGWYQGKVAGVLGTFTNDRNDDLVLPSGELSSSQRVRIKMK